MRKIAVVTVARSDYGIYLPLLAEIQKEEALELQIIAAGMHLSPDFGNTVRMIEEDGFLISERVDMLLPSDSPESIAKSMGRGVSGFAGAYERSRPDILVVLGDRFEMHSAALAALPFKIPVAHIHGGELTEGAIDDSLRHSITKLSHLHFVSTDEYARRVIQLGEPPWRITNCGALSLDNLRSIQLLDKDELEQKYELNLESPPLLVTFHPATLDDEEAGKQSAEVLAAVANSGLPAVFTLPNADTGGRAIAARIREFVKQNSRAWLVDNFGTQGYFSMMKLAAAMVGNSSSGIIEAASFKLPVVNIGTRQKGRVRAKNVIDVGYRSDEILKAIDLAITDQFKAGLSDLENPYGHGTAAGLIVKSLTNVPLDQRLLVKRFYDLQTECERDG